jgi:predicted enzyme related to lactoylglutathione lyase
MPRVVHFEIHAENPERAVGFYTAVFGWEFTKWEGPQDYWLIKTGPDGQPGINGGLLRRHGPGPADNQPVVSYVCTVDTDSVDRALQTITSNGGTVALPKMPIPGVGWLAYAKDTEGNIFGIMQPDPTAR